MNCRLRFAAVLLLACTADQSFAATLRVPEDHKTITVAIIAAATGDTVLVAAGSETRPAIEDHDCHHNDMAGIGCRDDARPIIVGNQCLKNQTVGIGFEDARSGQAVVVNNRVADNDKVAIGIHSGWKVRLIGNELSRPEGLPPVVMVFKGAQANFVDNTFRGSGVPGIRTEGVVCATRNYGQVEIKIVQPTTTAVIVGNTFESETDHDGVNVTGGNAVVEQNRVEKPKSVGAIDAATSN